MIMDNKIIIELFVYYLDIDSIKSLALSNKLLSEVVKGNINTYLCLTKNKNQDVDLSTMKWFIKHYELNVDRTSKNGYLLVLDWWWNNRGRERVWCP